MDNLYYVFCTQIVIFISLVTFVVLITTHLLKKKKFSILSNIILVLSLVGMYLFIPSTFLFLGYSHQSPELLGKAIKLSIIPYEKRLAYLYMSDIYNYDIFNQNLKDGNKAIMYLEKALKGEYSKYNFETDKLVILYSIKGDYEKTIQLNDILGKKRNLSLRNVYIMNDEYEKALSTFDKENKKTEDFLKADLYRKTGKIKEAEEAQTSATQIFENNLKNYHEETSKRNYTASVQKYKTVEAYKNWIRELAKEYKFN